MSGTFNCEGAAWVKSVTIHSSFFDRLLSKINLGGVDVTRKNFHRKTNKAMTSSTRRQVIPEPLPERIEQLELGLSPNVNLDDKLALYRLQENPHSEVDYNLIALHEDKALGYHNMIVKDGKIWKDMYTKEDANNIKEGKVVGIYHFGGKNKRWDSDTWDGTEETKPKFHALDPLDPELFYKPDPKTGLPVPFQAPTDADGNVYLSTDSRVSSKAPCSSLSRVRTTTTDPHRLTAF